MSAVPIMAPPTSTAKRHENIGQSTTVCFQYQIRCREGASDPRPAKERLVRPEVRMISADEAKSVILRYEWLGTMGRSTHCVGLYDEGELLGVACFGWPGGIESRDVCGRKWRSRAICLERGACVHWAPKNAGSYLVSHACKLMARDTKFRIFYAYADEDAGEIGTIYQACNWIYIGQGVGRTSGRLREYFESPDGKLVTSRTLRHRNLTKLQVLAAGWKVKYQKPKHKYVWFAGSRNERCKYAAALRYPSLPYPKRTEGAVVQENSMSSSPQLYPKHLVPVKVTLTKEWMDFCEEHAAARRSANDASRSSEEPRRGPLQGVRAEMAGVYGECTFHVATGLAWHNLLRTDSGSQCMYEGDVGPYEVRAVVGAGRKLLVYPSERDDAVFVLVEVHDAPVCTVLGWAYGREAKLKKYWETAFKEPCFAMPQHALHSVEEAPFVEELRAAGLLDLTVPEPQAGERVALFDELVRRLPSLENKYRGRWLAFCAPGEVFDDGTAEGAVGKARLAHPGCEVIVYYCAGEEAYSAPDATAPEPVPEAEAEPAPAPEAVPAPEAEQPTAEPTEPDSTSPSGAGEWPDWPSSAIVMGEPMNDPTQEPEQQQQQEQQDTDVIASLPPPISVPDPDRISLVRDPNIKYLDDVLSDVFERHGRPRLGGASGRGWSSHGAFQKCPFYFKTVYIDGIRGKPAMALEMGSAFHTFLALHYEWMLDEGLTLTPEVCKQELLAGGANAQAVLGAWRLYEAYASYYSNDYLYPIAIEERVEDPSGNTCRYDLIARVDTAQAGVVPGIYNIEHKTASRFDDATLDGWRSDGEILGQIMIWKLAKLDDKYGKLRGTIVNIVSKTAITNFHRTIVPAQAWHVRQHMEDLKFWSALQRVCDATSVWPRTRNSCVGRWGKCSLFDFCAENRKPSIEG